MPEKFRLVILGKLGVGKSALTVKYLTQRFIMDYDPYLDGKYRKVDIINNEPILVKIWDTYNQHGNYIDIDRYVKWADGYVIVYSTTNKASLLEAKSYMKNIHIKYRNAGIDVKPMILVGNKCDLEQYRQVPTLEGQQAAQSYGVLFYECSAAGNVLSVEATFQAVLREIQQEREMREMRSSTSINSVSDSISQTGSLPKAFTRTKSTKTSPKLLKKSSSTFRLFHNFKFFT